MMSAPCKPTEMRIGRDSDLRRTQNTGPPCTLHWCIASLQLTGMPMTVLRRLLMRATLPLHEQLYSCFVARVAVS